MENKIETFYYWTLSGSVKKLRAVVSDETSAYFILRDMQNKLMVIFKPQVIHRYKTAQDYNFRIR